MTLQIDHPQNRKHGLFEGPALSSRPRHGENGETRSLKRLQQVFESSATANPDALALVCGEERLSYAALEARSNQLSHYLRRQGIHEHDRIGLLLERSVASYVALLAILKAGAVFVPLDVSFPADRLAFIAEDADLALVVTTASLHRNVTEISCPTLVLENAASAIATEPPTRPVLPITDEGTCYILYTSGTTGRPKGVAVSHASICNFVTVCSPIYGVQAQDRVYQGMTLAFDFSVEEVWPTFAAGATLVAGPTDHRRLGGDLNQFLCEQKITVFCCVPTLLATLEHDVPSLRLLLVGGEACPADLVTRWSRAGRRMLNTYGPTETTVTASWAELRPGRPVTIGRPLPTYCIHIVDETLRPVASGQSGEICIGGPGVAEGYLNQPRLTGERFVADPLCSRGGRMYRTGDLGRMTPEGEVEYQGRIDTQVKIRGYRVELSEIESLLSADENVANALVKLTTGTDGVAELAAYVMVRGQPDFALLRQQLHTRLRQQLPTYMVPGFIEQIEHLPMLPSNKADRSRLPAPSSQRLGEHIHGRPPETPREQELAAVWSRVLGLQVHSVEADFFLDLGGHSLLAAQVVSQLRRNPAMGQVALADLYAHPTIEQLALHLQHQAPVQSVARQRMRHSSRRVACGGLVQGLLLYLSLIPWLAPTVLLVVLLTESALAPVAQGFAVVLVAALAPLLALLLPVAAKWLLLGRVRPGRYPLWGWFFCRWWLARKLLQTAPLDFLAGSPLLPLYLRLLGARVGHSCYLGTTHFDVPDLITIGDHASIGYDAELDPTHVTDGYLFVTPIQVGARAYVGTNAVISGGGQVGCGSRLGEQSLLTAGQTIPDGASWSGSPAKPTVADPQLDHLTTMMPADSWPPLLLTGFVLGFLLLQWLPTLLLVPGLVLIWAVSEGNLGLGLALTPVAGLIHVLVTILVVVLGKRLVLSRVQPGIYPLRSLFGLRKWFGDRLMQLGLSQINTLYSTLYLLPFLRLLGVRVGPRAEVSTVAHIDPDLLTLGPECFVADLAVIGAARFYNGHVVLGETALGSRAFVGNAALVSGDTRLPADSLIGVLSVAPAGSIAPGTSWLGSPAIFLPRRQSSGNFDESVTYRPPLHLVLCRLVIEFVRVVLPSTLTFAGLFVMALGIMSWLQSWSLVAVALVVPFLYLGISTLLTLVVVGLKWLLMGRYRPRVEPQWSHFVWRTELITGLYENVAVPWLLHWLAGTPWMASALRLFGARLGRRIYLETTYLTEFDLVHVDHDAAIAGQASLQTHLFEDRVMKMSTVTIGPGCTVGPRAVVLYDATLAAGAELDGLSLVMKGEVLPPASRWRGIPAQSG